MTLNLMKLIKAVAKTWLLLTIILNILIFTILPSGCKSSWEAFLESKKSRQKQKKKNVEENNMYRNR